MTKDEKIDAEAMRILGLPDDEQMAEIVCRIDAMSPETRDRVLPAAGQKVESGHARP